MLDLLPAVFVMWKKFQENGNFWTWKIILYSFHPVNMLVWPIFAAVKPTKKNLGTFNVSGSSVPLNYVA